MTKAELEKRFKDLAECVDIIWDSHDRRERENDELRAEVTAANKRVDGLCEAHNKALLQIGVLVDLCRDSLAILEIQPDLVRTDSGERGDGELGEICPKLAAAIEKHKTNEECMCTGEPPAGCVSTNCRADKKRPSNETSTSEYSSARARLQRGECSRCGSPGCCECT